MPTLIVCPSCASKLKLADNMKASKVACPKCKTVLELMTAPPAPVRKPQAAPAAKQPPVKRREPVPEVEPEDDPVETLEPGRKKKKRRRPEFESEKNIPEWAKWAALAGTVAATVITIIVTRAMGSDIAKVYAIAFAIVIPIDVVSLMASMFIAGMLGGGINFGSIPVAILKTIAIATVCEFVSLIDFIGPLLSGVVLYAGFLVLFQLDQFETMLLVVANWVIRQILGFLIFAAILTALMRGGRGMQNDGPIPAMPDNGEVPAPLPPDGDGEGGARRMMPIDVCRFATTEPYVAV
ncbi:MAG: hypothetical protein ACJ8C4_04565 [Gemmataceae bacterium]